MEITGLHAGHPSIIEADSSEVVWSRFVSFLNKYINGEKRGIIIAWNGASCDLDWIYRYTQAPGSSLKLPPRMKYFMDPYRLIETTSGCKIHKSKSKFIKVNLTCLHIHFLLYINLLPVKI